MPIITKPATITKNSAAQFTLSKSSLAAVASVAADSYFSNISNWANVILYYKSNPGNQQEILSFDATLASPTADFLASLKSRNVFEVQQILIKDFDGGYFRVARSELNTAEFDVDMNPPVSGYRYYRFNFLTSYYSPTNANPDPSLIVLSELALKVNGVTTYPVALYDDTGWVAEGTAGSKFIALTDGSFDRNIGDIYQGGSPILTLDMGSSVEATDALIGPRCNFGGALSNDGYFPARVKILGSNDNSNFTEIIDTTIANTYTGNQFKQVSLSNTALNAIVWDNYSPSLIPESDGGLLGQGSWTSANAYSEASKFTGSGDFALTMLITAHYGLQSLHGIKISTPDINATGYDNHSYGFYLNASSNLFVSLGGSYEGVSLGALSDNSKHVLKIARESGDLKFYLDSVLVYTVVLFSATTIYPYASNYNNGMTIESSSLR